MCGSDTGNKMSGLHSMNFQKPKSQISAKCCFLYNTRTNYASSNQKLSAIKSAVAALFHRCTIPGYLWTPLKQHWTFWMISYAGLVIAQLLNGPGVFYRGTQLQTEIFRKIALCCWKSSFHSSKISVEQGCLSAKFLQNSFEHYFFSESEYHYAVDFSFYFGLF